MGFRFTRLDLAGFLLIVAIVVYQSMLPPVVSLGNNGDFGKVVGHFSLGTRREVEASYAPVKYTFDPSYKYDSDFRSSKTLLAASAIAISSILSKTGDVDIRCIGAIHAAAFLLAIYLFLPVLGERAGPRVRFVVLAVVALVLCDVMYVSVFNSFYMDACAVAFLPLTIVLFCRARLWQKPADLIGFVLAAVFLVSAKPQHVPVAIPLAGLILYHRKIFPSNAVAFAAVIALTVPAWWTGSSLPSDYARNSLYA
jgi:hypothetical protein